MLKPYRLADRLQRWRAKSRHRPPVASGVLLVSCGGLGDTILFSHVIEHFLAYARDGEKVTVLLRQDGAKTAFLLPQSVELFVVDFRRLRKDLGYRMAIGDKLYAAHFRSVISTDFLRHPDLDEALLSAAQCSEKIGMSVRPWEKYQARLDRISATYSRVFESGPAVQDKILRWTKFANWLTGRTTPASLKFIARGETLKAVPPLVLIQPFSAVKAKQYDVSVYASLIDALPKDTQIKITGAPGEMDKNPDYTPLLNHSNVSFDSSGFEDLLGFIQAARLVVSVDTAVMHLSVAAGAPTLCLASAAYVGEIVPYAPDLSPGNVFFHYKTMACEGCLGNCIHQLQAQKFLCIADPPIKDLVEKALALYGASKML